MLGTAPSACRQKAADGAQDLADFFDRGDVSELRSGPPRDSVFLTLPEPAD
jgi:hypothetical protein